MKQFILWMAALTMQNVQTFNKTSASMASEVAEAGLIRPLASEAPLKVPCKTSGPSETNRRRILIAVFCILSIISATIVMVLYHTFLRFDNSNETSETIVTTTIHSSSEEGIFIPFCLYVA